MLEGLKLIITTIPSDSHTWNLVYLQLLLEEYGAEVQNLGSCVPFRETATAVRKYEPDLIVVSTVNGHARQQARELLTFVDESLQGRRPPAVIGGKLSTRVAHYPPVAKELLDAGYDAVFHSAEAINKFLAYTASLRTRFTFPRVAGGL